MSNVYSYFTETIFIHQWAELNGIGKDRYLVRAGDVISDRALVAELGQEKYRVVLANIVADVIIPLAPRALELMTDDGWFLCSGVIDTRSDEVKVALEKAGMTAIEKYEQNSWVSFRARKK